MALSLEEVRLKRDLKLSSSVADLAPLWLVDETFRATEESVLFSLVYISSGDGWIRERFKYDGFNDVLYRLGSRKVSDSEAVEIQQAEPYIDGDVASQPKNVPAFRAPSV